MQFPQIKIDQQAAKIGLNIKPPVLKLEQEKPVLEIKQDSGKLNIKADIVEVNVDNYPAQYDLGYKNPLDRGDDTAQKGREKYMQYLSTTSKNGDRLMRIEEGTSITDIATEESAPRRTDLGLKWKRGPEISVKEDRLEIDYKPQQPIFDSRMGQIEVDLDWGKVNVSMRKYHSTEIEVSGISINSLV